MGDFLRGLGEGRKHGVVAHPLQPRDEVAACAANSKRPEVDAFPLQAAARTNSNGAALFASTGCATCHTPGVPAPGARQRLPIYSNLLLNDMGPALDDRMQMGSAHGNEWRTAPLWQKSERTRFLHDGRAMTPAEAIAAHGGQGQAAATEFAALDATGRQALLAFLGCL